MDATKIENLNTLAYCFSKMDLSGFAFDEIAERREALEKLTQVSNLLDSKEKKELNDEISPLFLKSLHKSVDSIGLSIKQKAVIDELVLELAHYAGLVIKLSEKINSV